MITKTNSSIQVGIAALFALVFAVLVAVAPAVVFAGGGTGVYDDNYTWSDTGNSGYYDDGWTYTPGQIYDEYEVYDVYDVYDTYDVYNTYSTYPSYTSGYNYNYGYSYNPTPVYYYSGPSYSYNPPANTCVNGSCNTCVNGSCNTTVNHPPKEDDKPKHKNPVCALSASDKTIEEGDSTTLHWTSENASSANLSSFGSVSTGGSKTVSPRNDTTYTLTVRDNDGDTDTCDVTVRVEEEDDNDDLVCELRVSPSIIDEGDEATLRWDIEGADDARINQGIGSVDEDGGEEDVSPDETTTYRLTVENDDGDEEDCSAMLRVRNTNSNVTFTEDTVYLSDLPYTGSDMGLLGTIAYWLSIIGGGGTLAWFAFAKGLPLAAAHAFVARSSNEPTEAVVETPVADDSAVENFLTELRAGNTDAAIEHIRSAAHSGTGVEEFLASASAQADAAIASKVSAAYAASQVNGIRGAKAALIA